ncbi:MAG: hypothetical protein ARM1_0823 [Candidatus Micrarchaeota archaeon]|nr:MAG: hypothetical protein ARM1_0823 [Candidatus Micrarchaeota archaeon]
MNTNKSLRNSNFKDPSPFEKTVAELFKNHYVKDSITLKRTNDYIETSVDLKDKLLERLMQDHIIKGVLYIMIAYEAYKHLFHIYSSKKKDSRAEFKGFLRDLEWTVSQGYIEDKEAKKSKGNKKRNKGNNKRRANLNIDELLKFYGFDNKAIPLILESELNYFGRVLSRKSEEELRKVANSLFKTLNKYNPDFLVFDPKEISDPSLIRIDEDLLKHLKPYTILEAKGEPYFIVMLLKLGMIKNTDIKTIYIFLEREPPDDPIIKAMQESINRFLKDNNVDEEMVINRLIDIIRENGIGINIYLVKKREHLEMYNTDGSNKIDLDNRFKYSTRP